jgi:NADH-quinone oxidoreductase subunit M
VFTGEPQGKSRRLADLRPAEAWSAGGLLVLSVLIGLIPVPLLQTISPASASLVTLLGG